MRFTDFNLNSVKGGCIILNIDCRTRSHRNASFYHLLVYPIQNSSFKKKKNSSFPYRNPLGLLIIFFNHLDIKCSKLSGYLGK